MANYTYYVTKVGPCRRCGFVGRINDHQQAKQHGVNQWIIDCPKCKGTGRSQTQVPLQYAIADVFSATGRWHRWIGQEPLIAPPGGWPKENEAVRQQKEE